MRAALQALPRSARFMPFVMHRLSLRAIQLVVGLGILALLLRILVASGHSIIPASDETGYLSDGLLLLEGLAPGYKHVPSAPIDWLVMLTTGVHTLGLWLFGPAELGGSAATGVVAPILRPLLAMEQALFAAYADLNGLRLMIVVLQVLVGATAAAATTWRGWSIAGLPGALLAGALAAGTPLFVEFTSETRAYSLAWSLGLLAFAALADSRPQRRALASGVLIGLAIATRVEMGLAFVPLLLELLWREDRSRRARTFFICLAVAGATFVIAAPWYVTSLAGNLRQIISVRLLTPPPGGGSLLGLVGEFAQAGIAGPIVITIAGLLVASRGPGRWFNRAIGVWIALLGALALKPSIHGLRHDGALLLLTAVMVPEAIEQSLAVLASARLRQVVTVVAALLGLQVTVAGARAAWGTYGNAVQGDPVAWLEHNVPAGSTVYWVDGFKVPLPTVEASERLWAETANADAWRLKYRHAAERLALGGRLPRAMSEDPMQLERSQRRKWFILGAAVDTIRPRFDIHVVADGTPFAMTFADLMARLCAQGGTYVHIGAPIERLGKSRMQWTPANGSVNGVIIYTVEPPKPGEAKGC